MKLKKGDKAIVKKPLPKYTNFGSGHYFDEGEEITFLGMDNSFTKKKVYIFSSSRMHEQLLYRHEFRIPRPKK